MIDTNGSIIWHKDYPFYDLGPNQKAKYELFHNLLVNDPNLSNIIFKLREPMPLEKIKIGVTESWLRELVKMSETGVGYIDQGSTNAKKNMLYPAQLSCQGTYEALKLAINNKNWFVFNPVGGFHHAQENKSAGSGIFNDIAIGILNIRKEGYKGKITIIDCDFHPHDGTLSYFGGDETVFTASIHDRGWGGSEEIEGWGKGFGTNISYEVKKKITGDEYINILTSKILPNVKKFSPNLVIYVN